VSLIEFSQVAFGYTDERVIAAAAATLQPGEIVGLVGANGCGKTTLLSILLGQLAPEEGNVQRSRDARIAFVPQAAQGDGDAQLYSFVRAGRQDLLALEQELNSLRDELAAAANDPALATRMSQLEERFSTLDGHRWDAEVERLLSGLSFDQADFSKRLRELSGGQRQKACLARALLSHSNCLVFDEPTNHLDLAAQEFFVSYLKGLPPETGVLLVSHDRWLLDALCSQIWELDGAELYSYKGNYSAYVPRRELRREQQRKAFAKQQEHIARTEEYIRRNIAGQNTRQAQGRRKLLGRMERLEAPARDPQVSFYLNPQLTPGEQLLMVEDLCFGYGSGGGDAPDADSPETHVRAGHFGLALNPPLAVAHSTVGEGLVVDDATFTLYRGERLGIVGPNGCGKSTLLRLLARQLPAQRGMVAWGSNAELGIFSQDSADLGPDNDAVTELRRVESGVTDGEAREYLARFGFSGDDVYQQVRSLSGGEKSRLSLAKIFRRRPNVLLLDEPTNHLDIYAREALEQFLEAYTGSIVLVTHDRALLERICNRLVVFRRAPDSGMTCTFFGGGYSDYQTYLQRRQAEQQAPELSVISAPEPVKTDDPRQHTDAQLEELARGARCSVEAYCEKQAARARRSAGEIESRLAEIDDGVKRIAAEQVKADESGDYSRLAQLQEQIDELKHEEEQSLAQLLELEEKAAAWDRRGTEYAG
jgi:ATP-binding cassette subfamily F protein 3